MTSLLSLTTPVTPLTTLFLVTLTALYKSSSLIFLYLLKKMKMAPAMSMDHPSKKDLVMVDVELSLIKRRLPTKMLKQPLPSPVIMNKKFLLTHFIPKLEVIITSPKILQIYHGTNRYLRQENIHRKSSNIYEAKC